MIAAYERSPKPPEAYTSESQREIHNEMIEKVTDAFKPGWENSLEPYEYDDDDDNEDSKTYEDVEE
jgi:hypothetical protein